jgi:drug/metabolite transporter (DMT)-like permease
MAAIYALLSAFSYGCADFLGGYSSRKNPPAAAVAWSQAAGLAAVLIAAPIMGSESVLLPDLLWGIAAGISGAMGVLFLFTGLSRGMASIVSPLAALSGAVIPVIFGLAIGERPPLLTWMGIAVALPSILLLSLESNDGGKTERSSLILGLTSGFFFGGFFILISQSSETSGMWPLAAARIATVPLFAAATGIMGRSLKLARGTRRVTILSGVLDMAANVFYLLAFRGGYLISAVILTALYPAPTVLLQRAVIGERLSALRISGLVLSIAAAALIGIGG